MTGTDFNPFPRVLDSLPMPRGKLFIDNEWFDTKDTPVICSPCSGEKDSGIGREGGRYSIEEMPSLRLSTLDLESCFS